MLDVGYITGSNSVSVSGSHASQILSAISSSENITSAVDTLKGIDMVTPRIRVDNEVDLAILEYRSNKTGEVKRQFPSEAEVEAFKNAERISKQSERAAAAQASSSSSDTSTTTTTTVEYTSGDESSSSATTTTYSDASASYSTAAKTASSPVVTNTTAASAGDSGFAAGAATTSVLV